MNFIKASDRLPDDSLNPEDIIFRDIKTKKVLDIYSYWNHEHLELNDADSLKQSVGTLIRKDETEWLDETPSPATAEQPGKTFLYDDIQNQLEEIDSIADARDWVYANYVDGTSMHPDFSSFLILKQVGVVSVTEGENGVATGIEAKSISPTAEQPLREALERAIGVIEMECDDHELIADLRKALSASPAPVQDRKGKEDVMKQLFKNEDDYRYDNVIAALDLYASHLTGKADWVSVEDRLPKLVEPGIALQLIGFGDDGKGESFVYPVVWADNNFYLDITFSEEGIRGPSITDSITHWHPLPASPIS